jgi:hypothetical protein
MGEKSPFSQMLFEFIGQGPEDQGVTCFGIDFQRGVAVEVTDTHAIKKLLGNNHFRVFHGNEGRDTQPSADEAGRVGTGPDRERRRRKQRRASL